MLTYEAALVEARQHLYGTRPPHGQVWVLRDGERVEGGWFWWYSSEPIRFIRNPDGGPRFGGAPGFVVPDDGGEVRVLSWHQLPAGLTSRCSGLGHAGAL